MLYHRDYSLSGMDIKVAVFDDKIEITSPGKLPPTVDYSDMQSGQSSIRNKGLAPIFKRLGIIEQWGNGLKLIAAELKKYPEIGFDWKKPGMGFRVIFFKLPQESKTVEKTVEKAGEEILSPIKVNPKIKVKELQIITGLSRRGVEWNLAKLKQEEKIERIGSRKEGFWKVIEKL